MTVLTNNQETQVAAGTYAYKASGALDIQQQLFDEGFATMTDGSLTVVSSGTIDLAPSDIKIVNAGANTLTLKLISV